MPEVTEAWVLHKAKEGDNCPGKLVLENFIFEPIGNDEVLAEPIFGCWEGNMGHALRRHPVDICAQRGEDKVVIGNAGVVRILKTGRNVTNLREGEYCIVFCNGVWDSHGYPKKIFAYDAPGTIGLLAKRTKLHRNQLIPLPQPTRHSLEQWAAFSLRYITAWSNWRVAEGCWKLHHNGNGSEAIHVWGWGGGVAFAEIMLAQLFGFRTALLSSDLQRIRLIETKGILAINRNRFKDLDFQPTRYQSDPAYRDAYVTAEQAFLETVAQNTDGHGVSIFVDFIGLPVYRATLKALACPGVITSAGWKAGMNLSTLRALECMNWHIHVHTHYALYSDGIEAVQFAEKHSWLPVLEDKIFSWDEVPNLASAYIDGALSSYFPIFRVNET